MALRSQLDQAAPFAGVPVDVEIELARRFMRLRDILEIQAGTVVSTPKAAGDYLDIYVGGAPVARGEVVVLEKHIGIRIMQFEGKG